MSSELIDKINAMDGFQVVRFYNHFSKQLFEGLEITKEQVWSGIPQSIRDIPQLAHLKDLSKEERITQLKPEQAALIARSTLIGYAEDETFSPLIQNACDSYEDNTMCGGLILAVGAAASMMLLIATTRVRGKVGNVEFEKTTASPELVEKMFEPFAKIIESLFGKSPE